MKDTTKIFVIALAFAFLTGMYTAIVLNLGREVSASKGCSVTYSHGQEVHVLVGRLEAR